MLFAVSPGLENRRASDVRISCYHSINVDMNNFVLDRLRGCWLDGSSHWTRSQQCLSLTQSAVHVAVASIACGLDYMI